ncbi:hypothetical protein ABTE23_20985, partial [Acinetobacter baumannii]
IDYPLRSEVLRVQPLLERIAEEGLALSAGKHDIRLIVDGPDLKGNAEELRSAFTNLVTNAVRYTPEGGTITLRWQSDEQGAHF